MEEILKKAKEEGRYEWLKAADCYQKALTAVAKADVLKKERSAKNWLMLSIRRLFRLRTATSSSAR